MWAKKMGWSLLQGSWHRFIDKRLQKVLAFTSISSAPTCSNILLPFCEFDLNVDSRRNRFELASVLIYEFDRDSFYFLCLPPTRQCGRASTISTSVVPKFELMLIRGPSGMLHHIGASKASKSLQHSRRRETSCKAGILAVCWNSPRSESFISFGQSEALCFSCGVEKSNIARLPATDLSWNTRNWSKNYKQADGLIYKIWSSFFFSTDSSNLSRTNWS